MIAREVRPDDWWGQDPTVTPCPSCGCPIQGGPLMLSRHIEVVHPSTRAGGSAS